MLAILTSNGQITVSPVSGSGTPGGSNTQIEYNNSGAFGGASNLTTDGLTLSSASTTTYPALRLTENGTATGSPTIGQLAPIELNINSAGVNARDAGIVFKGYGSGTSGLPGSGGFSGVFFGFDGDNVFVMGNSGYPGATGTPVFAYLSGTYPEIFDCVRILDNTGVARNGTPELLISPTGYGHTGPAIQIKTQTSGTEVFSIDNPTGNTLIAGTLGVTGHITAEGVTSTGATGTGKFVFGTSPSITTGINDTNGNSMLAFTATASAVDGFTFTNAATANPATVAMAATGTDSNIKLALNSKGTAAVTITSGNTGATDALTITSTGATAPRITLAGTDRSVSFTPGGGNEIDVNGSFRASATNSYLLLENSNGTTTYGRLRGTAAATLQLDSGANGQWASLSLGVRDSGTTTVTNGLTIGHQSTGTPAAGLGSAILFNIDSTTTADQNAGQAYATWTTATHASRTSKFGIRTVNNAGALADVATFAQAGAVITGTTTNDSAATGIIGEELESLVAVGSAVSLTTATAANVTTISLTAGDWDVEGNVNFNETTSTVTARSAGISTTSATLPTDGSEAYCGVQSTVTSETNSIPLPRKRISIASTTTVYLVGKATFSAGTCTGFGAITARRVR